MPFSNDVDALVEKLLGDPTPEESKTLTPGMYRNVAHARERERQRRLEREDSYSQGRRRQALSEWDAIAAQEGDVDLSELDEEPTPPKEEPANIQDLNLSNASEFFDTRIAKLLRARATFIRLGHEVTSETVRLCSQEIGVLTKLNELMGMGMSLAGAAHFYTYEDGTESTYTPGRMLRVMCDGSRWDIYWDRNEATVVIDQDTHKDPEGVNSFAWPDHAESLPEPVREEAARFYQTEFERRNPSRWSEIGD